MNTRRHLALATIAGATAASLCAPARAASWQLENGVNVKLDATLTAGTAIRTESPDPAVLGTLSTARVGQPPGNLAGNAGGSDLNFARNRPVSTVAKGLFNLEVSRGDLGVALRARAWTDHELEHGSRAYGNAANGFAQNAPLSDAGFDQRARFSNAIVDAFNVFGTSRFDGERALDWRVGQQLLNWGTAQMIGGGINVINPFDAAAASRAGALPEETRIPVGLLHGRFTLNPATRVEGWAQYDYQSNVLNGCGTYLAVANYAPVGCNFVNVLGAAGANDPTAQSTGRFPKRAGDDSPSGFGQFGLSLSHRFADLGTEVRGYAMNYHSRAPSVRAINPDIAGGYGTFNPATGALSRLTDPNGVKYGLTYARNVHLFGASFDTALDPSTRVYGEFSYRPNQPLQTNASDLIAAFVQRGATSALNLAKGTNALPPGAVYDGYDRYKVTMLTLGTTKAFPDLAGASRVVIGGEVGLSHVAGLPDPGLLRYGRSDDYGVAQVAGGAACSTATAAGQKQCALDGFTTSNAWGYRLRVSATYAGMPSGATVTPSLVLGHDVSGYSHDGVFVEGRKTARVGLRADWKSGVYADMIYLRAQGGRYYTLVDRDTLGLSVGMRF